MSNARIMMWANYRRGPSLAVPAPVDDNSSKYFWYDRISQMAQHWASVGITDVLFPNPVKGESGSYRTGDGYNPYDHYDIGSKDQKGGYPTRFGTAEQLRRAVAICRANGINVLLDHVMHQCMGAGGGDYRYKGADGKTLNGRFPKTPSCFRGSPPRVPEDPVPSPADDFAFGDELCPVNAIPKGYVWNGLIEHGDWLFRTTGTQGARLDDMKGLNADFMKAFMTSKAMKGKFFFGEYASGNRNDTEWWVNLVDRVSSAADFDLHYNVIMPMCNDAGSGHYYMGNMAGRGMIGIDPMKSVTFVESMDSDTNGFATVVDNKELGYALLLTAEGLPQIYIRDYLREPSCYGLQHAIDNLCWIHSSFANGPTTVRHGDAKTFVFERTGAPNLLVGLNNDVWNPEWKIVTVQTGFGPNVEIHDYTGHNDQNYWTDEQGRVTLWIPPGANGRGYCCWSRAGLNKPVVAPSYPCTQTFFGAPDLDIPAAGNRAITVGRIWVAANTTIYSNLAISQVEWTTTSRVHWSIISPSNILMSSAIVRAEDTETIFTHGTTTETGWHQLLVTGSSLPLGGSNFALQVTYTAPKSLPLD